MICPSHTHTIISQGNLQQSRSLKQENSILFDLSLNLLISSRKCMTIWPYLNLYFPWEDKIGIVLYKYFKLCITDKAIWTICIKALTTILWYIAQMHSYSGPWEMCPRVLWGVRVNGKIQNPLGWRRITSHWVLRGERHRCCIDPADEHWMAGSLSKCQVPQTETPRQPGLKFSIVHGRFVDKPVIPEISRTKIYELPIIYIIISL